MRVIREIEVAGFKVQVKELTVGEIRAWFKSVSSPDGSADLIDATLFDEFSLPDIKTLTSLTGEQIDLLTPSEVRRVADAAKEVNADFFATRGRLVALSRQIVAGNLSG